jgi:tetratricopeptide (TPR) repeat protein
MVKKIQILIILLFIVSFNGYSQFNTDKGVLFNIKLRVVSKETKASIKNADVQVNGRFFRYHNVTDNYVVNAKVGDDLVVSHSDFETVYYTIKSDEDIKIEVKNFSDEKKNIRSNFLKYKSTSKKAASDFYEQFLDSAKYYKNIDIDKSLSFIERILLNSKNKKRNASAYKVLAGIYFYWKQYDLAIDNYKISINYYSEVSTEIQLAIAQFLHKDYVSSEKKYINILLNKLSSYETVIVREGLGNVYLAQKKYEDAIANYSKALVVAVEKEMTSKITDLNSKLADVFAEQGDLTKASSYFKKALNLASKEGKVRFLREQEKVADFFNSSQLYDDEIELRKESLNEIFAIDSLKGDKFKSKENKNIASLNSIINGWLNTKLENGELVIYDNDITEQSINYKIGRAYVQKEAYKDAIPFLKNSIDVSPNKNDLIVQKDATRKLSEVYATVGSYSKAFKTYQDYVKIVDTLYIKKQQEIAQAKRFNKKISENQNRISSLEKDRELTESKMNIAYKDKQLAEEINKRQLNLIYTLIAGILLLILLAYLQVRNSRQQKLANNLLALKSMRSQMNPHFIFNALNSVNSYIALNDERNANRYLSEFSVLMRTVLENSDEDFISLAKEIELIELYVKLEHNRFKDKFTYHVFIDSNINLADFNIPPMLLQPYIENAIWHGLRYKDAPGELLISMEVADQETIKIVIQDDGIGREKSKELKTENQLKRKSKGMVTIKNRIAILNDMYKDKISVNVTDVFENGEGTKVELLLKKYK